jgi:hypothetical protein
MTSRVEEPTPGGFATTTTNSYKRPTKVLLRVGSKKSKLVARPWRALPGLEFSAPSAAVTASAPQLLVDGFVQQPHVKARAVTQ